MVSVCQELETDGTPSVRELRRLCRHPSLRLLRVDRYNRHIIPEGHLWVPIPRDGDSPQLPLNEWASQRTGVSIHGIALLVQAIELQRLRRLQARHSALCMDVASLKDESTEDSLQNPPHLRLGCTPLCSQQQERRLRAATSTHRECCKGCREARNLTLADHYATKEHDVSAKPTHAHCPFVWRHRQDRRTWPPSPVRSVAEASKGRDLERHQQHASTGDKGATAAPRSRCRHSRGATQGRRDDLTLLAQTQLRRPTGTTCCTTLTPGWSLSSHWWQGRRPGRAPRQDPAHGAEERTSGGGTAREGAGGSGDTGSARTTHISAWPSTIGHSTR